MLPPSKRLQLLKFYDIIAKIRIDEGLIGLRIIVFSDSHGNVDNVMRIFEKNKNADLFIFLGDGERDVDTVSCLYPEKRILSVCGNCDMYSMKQGLGITKENGKQIVFLHGHSHFVKSTKNYLYKLGKDYQADFVLFGHTHQRYLEYRDGTYYLNPGSSGCSSDGNRPSYAWIDITDKGVLCNHVDL